MRSLWLFLVMLTATSAVPVQACSYPPRVKFADALPSAKHVFVFQLVSIELDDSGRRGAVRGKIRLVETLKGAPTYSHVAFSTDWCGGNRLDVGHYFVIAASEPGTEIELEPAALRVLDITLAYAEGRPEATKRAGVIPAISLALRGQKLPEQFRDGSLEEYTQTFTVPPPPPPPQDSPSGCGGGA